MDTITIGPYRVYYTIVRSSRRTVKLRVASADRIEITAPHRFSASEAVRLLQAKQAWLCRQLAQLADLAANAVNTAAEPGAELLYLGGSYTLTVFTGTASRPYVTLEDSRLIAHLPAGSAARRANLLAATLKAWYARQAADLLVTRTEHWAALLGLRPGRVSIREQKSRWGSCSSRGNINYNWRIVMAPPAVVDYLIVHELCHLRVPNHSAAFWQLVADAVPAYKDHRKWLRVNGPLLFRLFGDRV